MAINRPFLRFTNTSHSLGSSFSTNSAIPWPAGKWAASADHIVLWPLGGIAFVNPPRRPGAVLWSIAAGPLVNVALVPVLELLWIFAAAGGIG